MDLLHQLVTKLLFNIQKTATLANRVNIAHSWRSYNSIKRPDDILGWLAFCSSIITLNGEQRHYVTSCATTANRCSIRSHFQMSYSSFSRRNRPHRFHHNAKSVCKRWRGPALQNATTKRVNRGDPTSRGAGGTGTA